MYKRRYRTSPMNKNITVPITWLAIPVRNKNSLAKRLVVVAAASPCTIIRVGTYNSPYHPRTARVRYNNPANLAVFLREMISSMAIGFKQKVYQDDLKKSPSMIKSFTPFSENDRWLLRSSDTT